MLPELCPNSAVVVDPCIDRTAALLARIAGGDDDAFTQLYVSMRPKVFGAALRILRNPALAAEAVQECFLEVWLHAGSFDPERGSGVVWVVTIARRRAIDSVRSVSAAARRDDVFLSPDRAVRTPDTEELALAQLEAEDVRCAVDQLSGLQREAIERVYLRGSLVREAALSLGVPLATLKTRVRDGVINLQRAAVEGAF